MHPLYLRFLVKDRRRGPGTLWDSNPGLPDKHEIDLTAVQQPLSDIVALTRVGDLAKSERR